MLWKKALADFDGQKIAKAYRFWFSRAALAGWSVLSLRAEARRPRRRGWKFSFELSQSGLWGPDAVSMAEWNDVARSTKGILGQGMPGHVACVPGTASRSMGFCNFGGAIRMSSSASDAPRL